MKRRTVGVLLLAAVLVASTALRQADAVTVTATVGIVSETFTGPTTDNNVWALPNPGTEVQNEACLTGDASTPAATVGPAVATTIPQCSSNPGLNGLQLTQASPTREGGVNYANSVPTTSAIDVSFSSNQFGGNGADGITFFFAASDPLSSDADALTLGQLGGSLGYASAGFGGLTNGYLGVGLDAYGNFASSGADGNGCTAGPGQLPQSVTVRGPGSGSDGYCFLDSQAAFPLDDNSPYSVPVEVVINPTDNSVTTASGHDVAAGTFLVAFTPLEGSDTTLDGALPDATGLVTPSWLDGNGVPKRVTFGWTAATGSSKDIHIINNVDAVALTAPPASTATALQFVTQPIDTQVDEAMQNPDTTVRHVQVGGFVTAGGDLDPNYTGTVTLGFGNNPGNAQFVVGESTEPTMTATAVDGVADFSPVVINAAGFGYTLTATDDSGLTARANVVEVAAATSDAFTVAAAATACPAGQTCTTTTSSPSSGDSATIRGQAGGTPTVITATYGGNVFPVYRCRAPVESILTFAGDRPKVITVTIPAKYVQHAPVTTFCYGQPTPFIQRNLALTRYYNVKNHEYEGFLPWCGQLHKPGPCLKSVVWLQGRPERAVILSATADPHLVH